METWRRELYLKHHGIEGMHWGIRNGPPYPLKSRAGSPYTLRMKNMHFKNSSLSNEEYARAKDLAQKNKEIWMPYYEKSHVTEEFDNNCTPEEKESAIITRPVGDFLYTAINLGHSMYKFINKKSIERPKTDDLVDEVLTDMFGADWRDYIEDE